MSSPIQSVIDHDLCICCGACAEACPPKVIKLAFNAERGSMEVLVNDESSCSTCLAPCYAICPSREVDFSLLANRPDQPARDGWTKHVWTGYAPEFRQNGISSSGGILRSLIANALAHGTPVICLASKIPGDGDYDARLLTDIEDMARIPGSIYHSISFFDAISLLRSASKPCLLVAIPCHLEGLLTFIRKAEPALEAKIELIVGIVCGWMYSHHGLSAFMSYKKIKGPMIDVCYRGEDKVGKLKITTTAGTQVFDRRIFNSISDMLDYRASFSTDVNRLRCRVCQNHINLLADIVVGDAWLQRIGNDKVSIVVGRTERGVEVIHTLQQNCHLVLEDGGFDDVNESQSVNLVEGQIARKLAEFFKAHGVASPVYYFADGVGTLSFSFRQYLLFRAEMLKRYVLRSGRYRLFRAIYALLHGRMIVSAILRGWKTHR